MSVLWVLPLVVLAAGAVLISARIRTTAEATIALRDECARLEQLRLALDDLRDDADMTRDAIDRIRSGRHRSGGP